MPPPSDRRGLPGRLMAGGALFAASLLLIAVPLPAQQSPSGQMIELELQTRDPESGVIRTTRERVDPSRVGVIAVDVWNWHWCKTATMRVDAFVPRINEALAAARSLGMTVMLCPSDVVDLYVGQPQRERVLSLPSVEVPDTIAVTCPPVPDAGGCACGRERCAGNYGWDGMHPDLCIGPDDWMPDTRAEVYAICRERRLTHLIYVGFHTQVCLLGKPMGLRAMKSAGLQCVLARDMTDAHPGYDPARGFTPDLNTEQVVEHFEKYLAPTIHLQKELGKLGIWKADFIGDPVRIAPWGTDQRPHLFEEDVVVTLSAPLQSDAEIHYTLDGTAPDTSSPRYSSPLHFAASTRLRSAAFLRGQQVSRESVGTFVRLGAMPEAPDVHLGDLEPTRSVGFGHTHGGVVRYAGDAKPAQEDTSNRGGPIRINRRSYDRGIGVHAPSAMDYAIEPGSKRFVALAGVDEHLLDRSNGSNLARYPSVSFKVLIDGQEVAASPVMRIQSPAWRFSVDIPSDARRISLITTDGGDGSREDFADWADAGFVLGHEPEGPR